jgi:hypothetical protein
MLLLVSKVVAQATGQLFCNPSNAANAATEACYSNQLQGCRALAAFLVSQLRPTATPEAATVQQTCTIVPVAGLHEPKIQAYIVRNSSNTPQRGCHRAWCLASPPPCTPPANYMDCIIQ